MVCQYFAPTADGAETFTIAMPKLTFGRGCLAEAGARPCRTRNCRWLRNCARHSPRGGIHGCMAGRGCVLGDGVRFVASRRYRYQRIQ